MLLIFNKLGSNANIIGSSLKCHMSNSWIHFNIENKKLVIIQPK